MSTPSGARWPTIRGSSPDSWAAGSAPHALHVVTDWPGYFPHGPEIVRVLLAGGADPDARSPGDETALHWAANSDDTDVGAALLDGGADIEAPDGSIGTPLDNAIGYACWHMAALLAARGARIDKLWHAAALGRLDRLEQLLGGAPPSPGEVSQAFWHACAAGSDARPSASSPPARSSTGRPTTPRARHWSRPRPGYPARQPGGWLEQQGARSAGAPRTGRRVPADQRG